MNASAPLSAGPRSTTAMKAVLLSGSCFTLLAGASISPALPGIYAEFSATPNAALLSRGVLSVGPLFMAVGAAVGGLLINRIGRRRLLVASICGTGVFGTSGYFMDSLYTLLMTRVLLGLCVGGVMTSCMTLLGDFLVEEERRRFLGWQTAAMKLGAVTFLLLGGVLAGFSWRHPFLVDLLAFAVLPGAIWAIREPGRGPAAAGVPAAPRTPEQDDGERRTVRLVFALAFITQVLFFAVPAQLPFFMTDVLNQTPQRVGAVIAISTITSATIAPLYSWASRRMGTDAIFVLVLALMGLGFVVLSSSETVTGVMLSMLIIGASVGFLLPNLSWVLLESCTVATRGRSVGAMNTAQFLGQFASPLVAALPVSAYGLPRTFAGLGGTSLVLALVMLAVFSSRRRQDRLRAAHRGG